MELKTQRLILRPWLASDAQRLFELAKDPEVGPAAGWPVHTSVENSCEVIRKVLAVPETYAICLAEDPGPIGSISLKLGQATDMTDRPDECELGYWLGKAYWGRGIMPEAAVLLLEHAFCDLGMQAVWCGYYDGNLKSSRVQEKLGFVYHHTTQGLELKLLNETRTGHCTQLTKERWKKVQLFKCQKQTLDLFLERHAIDQKQYDKSLGNLRTQMGMHRVE